MEPLMSQSEAAEILGISERTLFRLSKAGKIAWIQVGNQRRYEHAEIEAFKKRNRSQPAEVVA